MNAQWTTIIGGFLAGGTGWFVSWRNDRRSLKQKKIFFTRAIKDDLNNSKLLYKKIIEEWGKSSTIWFDTLGEILASREIYSRNKELILVYPENIRNQISGYYYKSGVAVNYLRYLQDRKMQIGTTIKTIMLDIKTNNPDVPDGQINDQIFNALGSSQHYEYEWIKEALPKKVEDVRELIQQIDDIFCEIDKVKI